MTSDADLNRCWERLKPAVQDLARIVRTAPLSEEKRRVLAVYVAGHFFGDACGALQEDPKLRHLSRGEIAQQVADMITEILRKEEMQ